jgi:hypothetical protein
VPSTFTPNKSLERPATGDYNNVWAPVVNLDWTAIDTALGGNTAISVTGVVAGVYVLSLAQYQPPNIIFTGVLGANLTYAVPTGVGGVWSVFNNTSGAFVLNFASSGGGFVALAQGQRSLVVCEGTTMQFASTPLSSANPSAVIGLAAINGSAGSFMRADAAPALNQAISPTWTQPHTFASTAGFQGLVTVLAGATFSGGTLDATATTARAATQATADNSTLIASTAYVKANLASYAPLASPALTGTPTSPTAASATNTTQLATTAFAYGSLTATGNGSTVLPNGLIFNWGVTPASGTSQTVTFTTPYTIQCFSIVCTPYGGGSNWYTTAPGASLTQFTITFTAAGIPFSWWAVGK